MSGCKRTNGMRFTRKKEVKKNEEANRKEIDWISIDEKVPINGQRVLVCFDDGFILIGAYMDYAEDEKEPYWVFDGEEDFNLEDAQVIGWMPLPESYKELVG